MARRSSSNRLKMPAIEMNRWGSIAFLAALAILFMPAAGTTGPQGGRQTFNLIPAESSFWVFVGKAGLFSALAHDHEIGVKSFRGRITISERGIGEASLEMEIDARSLVVLDRKIGEADRAKIARSMHEDVLESAKYPQMLFKSVSVSDLTTGAGGEFRFRLTGDLTLHGVTKRVTIPVSAFLTPGQLRAVGKYTLKQSDFGIKPYSTAGGTIKVKDEVVVNFQIVARS